jgi:hypothetical protein
MPWYKRLMYGATGWLLSVAVIGFIHQQVVEPPRRGGDPEPTDSFGYTQAEAKYKWEREDMAARQTLVSMHLQRLGLEEQGYQAKFGVSVWERFPAEPYPGFKK